MMNNIVKQGLQIKYCSRCQKMIIVLSEIVARGGDLICEQCAKGGLTHGHVIPVFAVEWAQATGTELDAAVCVHESQAWQAEAEYAKHSGQPELERLALMRSAWMSDAYRAFAAAEGELYKNE